jgi:hypothetical protein
MASNFLSPATEAENKGFDKALKKVKMLFYFLKLRILGIKFKKIESLP